MRGCGMKSRQAGLATVEFAIVGAVLFLVVFTVIETGRLMWAWETLTEATRRGARVAAVCPVNHPGIANMTVLNPPDTSGESAILPGLLSTDVVVEYLDSSSTMLANPANDDWCDIRYVRVRITGYTHDLLIPFVSITLNAPAFETTLPAESLGMVPGVGFQCFGVSSATPICA